MPDICVLSHVVHCAGEVRRELEDQFAPGYRTAKLAGGCGVPRYFARWRRRAPLRTIAGLSFAAVVMAALNL
jgi:hypothetical protein